MGHAENESENMLENIQGTEIIKQADLKLLRTEQNLPDKSNQHLKEKTCIRYYMHQLHRA